jgi:CO dehydrogenase/acetyl-CoA synthase alpha subunit
MLVFCFVLALPQNIDFLFLSVIAKLVFVCVILGANFRAAEARKITGNVAIAGGADFSLSLSAITRTQYPRCRNTFFPKPPQLDRLRKKVVLPSDTLSQLKLWSKKIQRWMREKNAIVFCIFLDRVL